MDLESQDARTEQMVLLDILAIGVHTLLGFAYTFVVIAAAYEIARVPKHGITSYVTKGMMAALFVAICIQASVSPARRYRHARLWLLVTPLLVLYWGVATWI